jgi:tRNA pseudouridine55 synthase
MRPIVSDSPSGLVLLNKEAGRTSFQALYPVKKLYGRSVGHTGTLDRFAEGLLVVLVGKFTKFNPLFTAFDKVYEADFTFGIETSTLDPEGEIVFKGPNPDDTLLSLADRWTGSQMQVPPVYSAIHIDGRRASDRVRDGQDIVMPARPIVIHSLEVKAWRSPVLTVRIHCSKGTYVRSIARDWGRASGFGAHVTRLRRWAVGPFALPETPMEFKDARWALETLGIPTVTVDATSVSSILNGRAPTIFVPELGSATSERVGLEDPDGRLIAVLERKYDLWVYLFVDRGHAL